MLKEISFLLATRTRIRHVEKQCEQHCFAKSRLFYDTSCSLFSVLWKIRLNYYLILNFNLYFNLKLEKTLVLFFFFLFSRIVFLKIKSTTESSLYYIMCSHNIFIYSHILNLFKLISYSFL